jgi:glutamate N-acetyltransferase/amino-acid N-acetyltransferase
VQLSGAKNARDARKMARQIICSPLVKTAIHGGDNNWGRVQAAIGSTTIKVKPERIKIEMLNLKTEKVTIKVDLGLGQASARAWGCDLSKAYIDINTNYN